MPTTFESRLADRYGSLSDALRQAADFLRANPVDIATRPLRTVSRESGVSPAAFSRLSRALDYENFDDLREEFRASLGRRVQNFADRAEQLQDAHGRGETAFLDDHLSACQTNLALLADRIDRRMLEATADRLSASRKVLLQGGLGSTGVTEHLAYLASFHTDNWVMAGRMGASLGGGIIGMDARDAIVIVTKPPFANRSIKAAELAASRGVYVVVITDTPACSALQYASSRFIVPTESPHFYSSYVGTLFLVETLIGMVVGRTGETARTRIADVENANRTLAEVWSG